MMHERKGKMGEEMKEEKIEYRIFEEEGAAPEFLESYVDLLHNYLNRFISREALKEDVEYSFEKGRVIGAYHDEELIGAVAGVYTPFFDKFHIAHIAVEEDYQGMNIGTELTEKIVPEEHGATVHLNKGNPEIERFYEKIGFQPTHTRFKRPKKGSENKKPSD